MAQSLEGGWQSSNKMLQFDHDPGDTAANDVSWQDMKGFGEVTMSAFASALSGNGVTAFLIIANSESDGGGTDATIVTHAVGDAPDAVGDWLVQSVTAEMIKAKEVIATTGRLRYVSAKITHQHNDDESVVAYIFSKPFVAKRALTTNVVA